MERRSTPALDGIVAALRVVAEPDRWRVALPELRSVATQIRRGEPVVLVDEELVREGVLPAELGFLIRRIDELFDKIVAQDKELSAETLLSTPEGRLMRALAHEALTQLGYPRASRVRD